MKIIKIDLKFTWKNELLRLIEGLLRLIEGLLRPSILH